VRDDERTLTDDTPLRSGRDAFARKAWSAAYEKLAAADVARPLEPEDLERLATAAYLIGDDDASVQAHARAHAAFLARGEARRAARSAFWLAFTMMDRPAHRAQAAGWIARAQRLLDEVGDECAERGWMLCAAGRQRISAGDAGAARDAFREAATLGTRLGDRDLAAMARHGEGRALLAMRRTEPGLALLDEAMVAVTAGELSPIVAGAVYCSVITACQELFDLHRAQEWTAALRSWCESQPDLVPFRGYCLIRRSELMQLRGRWDEAVVEIERACERLATATSQPEAGAAFYQRAELHRVRGELDDADEAYRLASQAGRNPQPGLALLRLAQGNAKAADASIRVALGEKRDARSRVQLLGAAVEIMLANGDIDAARAATAELADRAAATRSAFLEAAVAHARGAIDLAGGEPLAAAEAFRAAAAGWREVDAPYELARTRVLLGLALRELGDHDGATLELDSAHDAFETLGAAPEAARVDSLTPAERSSLPAALTGREIEVLRLIATGATNRAIGAQLGISERTVARHASNIFTKLDLPSRAAATAYAYDHKLV
jgi:DNA-binding CsgD family transcriptional regulator